MGFAQGNEVLTPWICSYNLYIEVLLFCPVDISIKILRVVW